jgi:hypothetical protein
MEFLADVRLLQKARRLMNSSTLKIAISYWGKDGIRLLQLDPNRPQLQIVCCLQYGKSDPDIIKQFGRRARQLDRLHAKVIWTPGGAIVSSANASSNGLSEEESIAGSLIEAGIYTDNPAVLRDVERWFDELYSVARGIDDADLAAARRARDKRPTWGRPAIGPLVEKPSLLEAVQGGLTEDVRGRPIWLVLWSRPLTERENASVERVKSERPEYLQRRLGIDPAQFNRLSWYMDWSNLPKDAVVIDARYNGQRLEDVSVWKTLEIGSAVPIKVGRTMHKFTFVLKPISSLVKFRLTSQDKRTIRERGHQLWMMAKGDSEGRVLRLSRAAKIIAGAEVVD